MLVNIYLYIFRVAFFSLSVYFKRDIVETFRFVSFVIRERKKGVEFFSSRQVPRVFYRGFF